MTVPQQNNKKYFCVADIHSFAKQMKIALRKAGFDKRNKNHILIVCGDIFDRGPDALGVYRFIQGIPRSRRILIRGNHEELFLKLLKKKFPDEYDFMNYTVDTFCQIAQMPADLLDEDTYDYQEEQYLKGSRKAWAEIVSKVKEHSITKWLQSDEWKNYYEVDKYIFVHSFIPLHNIANQSIYNANFNTGLFTYFENWREAATDVEWADSRWGCPWKQYLAGLFEKEALKEKTLVCGHWHTSDFYRYLKHIFKYMHECAPVYYSKNLIGLDGGVVYNSLEGTYIHDQNILVIDENMGCFDKYGNKLDEEPYSGKQADNQKTSYRVLPTINLEYEISLCMANCATPCARKNCNNTGVYTTADFSKDCSDYVEKLK